MGFETLETEVRPIKGKFGSISYNRKPNKKGTRSGRPSLIICVPTTLTSNFKPPKDALFLLQVGTGDDYGRARIVASKDGTTKPIFMKWAVRFTFGFVPLLDDEAAEKEQLVVRPLKDAFEIDLPAWFTRDLPNPKTQKVGKAA